MKKINLKRILSKESVNSVIENIIGNTGLPLYIQDVEGTILMGESNLAKPANDNGRFPILFDSQVIGWVSGSESASTAASFLTYLVSEEFEKKELGRDALNKYKQLNLLYDISEKMTATCLDAREISRLVIEEIKKIIPATNVEVILQITSRYLEKIDEKGGVSSLVDFGNNLIKNVFFTGISEIVNDIVLDSRFQNEQTDEQSMMCSPMKVNQKTIGVIKVSSTEMTHYNSIDLKMLNTLASQTAVAIENARLYNDLKTSFIAIIDTLAETMDKRDPYTGGHTQRVKNYSMFIGRMLGLSEKQLQHLLLAAMLHDIGKIGVRDYILCKKGKLTFEEYEEMKKHAEYGAEILKHIKILDNALPGVRHHHERYDGTGYPQGLSGKEIDINARIIAVADSFDAMTTDRPYRKAMSKSNSIEELRRNAGTQFDPEVVEAFLRIDIESSCNIRENTEKVFVLTPDYGSNFDHRLMV